MLPETFSQTTGARKKLAVTRIATFTLVSNSQNSLSKLIISWTLNTGKREDSPSLMSSSTRVFQLVGSLPVTPPYSPASWGTRRNFEDNRMIA